MQVKKEKREKRSFWLKIIGGLAGVGLAMGVYALWEYRNIQVTTLPLLRKSNVAGIKIVYASDFQYDTSYRDEKMQREMFQQAVDLINEQDADIILLGGDYTTYPIHWREAATYLAQLSAPLGVYGIFGNHDAHVQEELRSQLDGRITFLENEAAVISHQGRKLCLYGVEDLWYGAPQVKEMQTDADYSILLTHNPDYIMSLSEEELAEFDLVLAGHTHAGQMTFFGLVGIPPVVNSVTDYGERFRYGLKQQNGHNIYITAGLGGNVLGLPLRFGARPEIVVIE